MSQVGRYVQRVVGLPQVLDLLTHHPDGLPLADVAGELGVDAGQLRETVLAYYRVDLVEYGVEGWSQPVVEFVGGEAADDTDADDVDPRTAPVLRVTSSRPERELGIEHVSAAELAALHQAGTALLGLEPGNTDLADAVRALGASLVPVEPDGHGSPADDADDATARGLARAVAAHRRVRIGYARSWRPGADERVVEPYRLVRTRRGWEVDAGPPDAEGRLRTYLVSGVTAAQVLDDTFVPPDDVDDLVAANRAITAVELVVPQDRRWAVDRFAERVEVLQEDESDVKLRAHLLPPVAQRLGLVLVTAGPDAYVMEPPDLADAGRDLAADLLAHHRGTR